MMDKPRELKIWRQTIFDVSTEDGGAALKAHFADILSRVPAGRLNEVEFNFEGPGSRDCLDPNCRIGWRLPSGS